MVTGGDGHRRDVLARQAALLPALGACSRKKGLEQEQEGTADGHGHGQPERSDRHGAGEAQGGQMPVPSRTGGGVSMCLVVRYWMDRQTTG